MPAARTLVALAMAAGVALSGCGSSTTGTSGDSVSITPPAATSPPADDAEETTVLVPGDESPVTQIEPSPGELPLGPVPEEVVSRAQVQAAVADFAERQGVAVDEVAVAGYAEVTWPDGSLGCPQPGVMYTQALVPGQQLILQVGDTTASYHAADGKPFAYCASPGMPLPGGSGSR
jgi:hypothetical protein